MPSQFFTNGDDNYTVQDGSDYYLTFLDGNDILSTTGGTNINAAMGEGDDLVRILAGTGTYAVYGESGNDRLELYVGGTADGGSGNDEINIRGGNDFNITGGTGDDQLTLFVDTTNLSADLGAGNDVVVGDGHTITGNIWAGEGNDYIVDVAGGTIYGGTGDDIYRIGAGAVPTIVENASEGTDTVQIAAGISYTLTDNVENLVAGGYSGSTTDFATLTGNALDNTIMGSNNDERINGLAGSDQLYGRGGDDQLNGGGSNDLLDGGAGNDTLQGQGGNDTLYGRAGADTLIGGTGNDIYYIDGSDTIVENANEGTDTVRTTSDYTLGDNIENGQIIGTVGLTLTGNTMDNTLTGGGGDDTIYGGGGNDTIKGGEGNDTIYAQGSDTTWLYGNNGDDHLYGADGADHLYGGAGNDVLWGGGGADILSGGDGTDTFLYTDVSQSTPAAPDYITDYLHGDTIDLSGIDANSTTVGDDAFNLVGTAPTNNPGDLWYSYTTTGDGGSNTTFYGDTDGDGIADFQVIVHSMSTDGVYFNDLVY